MKKLVLIVLCMALVMTIAAGCEQKSAAGDKSQLQAGNGTGSTEQTDLVQQTESSEATDATQQTEASKENLSKLNVPVYEETELIFNSPVRLYKDVSAYYLLSANTPHKKSFLMRVRPMTALRVLSAESSYAMYDTDTGYRMYLFFDDREGYGWMVGYPIVVKDVLSYSDFAGLKVGDSIDKVEQTDSVTTLYKHLFLEKMDLTVRDTTMHLNSDNPIATVHYLQDGILKIHYAMHEEGKLVIAEIIYNEDYCLVDALDRTLNFKIKNIDLPGS